jgi:nickel/cobalt transporter (NiCoT) family protein
MPLRRIRPGRRDPARRRRTRDPLAPLRSHRAGPEFSADTQLTGWARGVVGGLPFYAVLSPPILFAVGLSLFDTADGCFMNFAYDWAFSRPIRKVYYNLTITGLSVFVAVFIGAIEVLGLLAQDGNLSGAGWAGLQNFNISTARFVIVGVFVLTWIVALSIWRLAKIEQWDTANATAQD